MEYKYLEFKNKDEKVIELELNKLLKDGWKVDQMSNSFGVYSISSTQIVSFLLVK